MELFKSLLDESNQKINAFFKILYIAFLYLKQVCDNFTHCGLVRFPINCCKIYQLSHIEDPVIINQFLIIGLRKEMLF